MQATRTDLAVSRGPGARAIDPAPRSSNARGARPLAMTAAALAARPPTECVSRRNELNDVGLVPSNRLACPDLGASIGARCRETGTLLSIFHCKCLSTLKV